MKPRKIIHIDMDCFFAAIECRDDPSVADKPVGVGGDSPRSVLTTCNYIARKFGCRSAMPVFMAREKCPQLIIKPVRFEVYRSESRNIRAIFREYTELVEPLSLDEAYLDVSHQKRYAWELALEIRKKIFHSTGLTASAGVAANKMLAKIASDWCKPNGQFAVLPEQVCHFMKDLPIRRIPGIGPKAEQRLIGEGVKTCGDLQKWSIVELHGFLGPSWAAEIYERCRGIDERPVESSRPRKSISVERTFENNLVELVECKRQLSGILKELQQDWEAGQKRRPFRSIFIKLKFANFQTTTRECRCVNWDPCAFEPLLEQAFGRSPHAVRLIGAGLRYVVEAEPVEDGQLELAF
jgi:DNA polymerase-4